MCTYNIVLDDRLVDEAKHTLEEGVSFQNWLQQQVELVLMTRVGRIHNRRPHRHKGLSDEQLAIELSQYPHLTDANFPELSKNDYAHYIKKTSGHISKGLEEWL